MATININIPEHLVSTFCCWFSNSGEQDFFESHVQGYFDPVKREYVDATTYLCVEGFGIDEPITIVEYDKETDKRVS